MKANHFLTLTAVLFFGTAASARTWTHTSAPANFWTAVASSADGTRLIAAEDSNPFIFLSTNSGVTWISNNIDSSAFWKSAASSADGNVLIVASAINYLYVSTNAGATWTPAPITNDWTAVAASASGTTLLAASVGSDAHGGLLYTSTNSGVTWFTNDVPVSIWGSAAASADGTKLMATSGFANGGYPSDGQIFISTNSGTTWNPAPAGSNFWTCIVCSADGAKLVAANDGDLFYSTNAGLTWTSNGSPAYIWTLASSADGNELVAGEAGGIGPGAIYTSSDSGASWTSNSLPIEPSPYGGYRWALASSADGAKLVAAQLNTSVPGNSGIFTSYSPPSPQLNLASSKGNLTVDWIVPSTNFVLQQAADLSTSAWSDVTNVPVLNLTNLQNQVMLPTPAGKVFYRLKTP